MKKFNKIRILLLYLSIIILSCNNNHRNISLRNSQRTNIPLQLTVIKDSVAWVSLFNSKTFEGWRSFKSKSIPNGWIIEDGNLISKGNGEDIMTLDEFENFELILEWKLSKGGNSGILYNVTTNTDAKYPYEVGSEYQIIDEKNYKIRLKDTQKCGCLYSIFPAIKGKILYSDKYNKSRIVIINNHVQHWLNGIKVLEYDRYSKEWIKKTSKQRKKFPYYCSSPKGHILLQKYKDSTIWFRNIRIKNFDHVDEGN